MGKFAVSFFMNASKCLLLVTAASMVNISTTSFISILSAASLAIGLALQGLLKDLAAGILLLIFQPYKLEDLVEVAGETGKVNEIGMFETTLRTLDNKTVIVPNSEVKIVTNLSDQSIIRVDVPLKIGHDNDLQHAKALMLSVPQECPCVLREPAAA